MKNYGKVALVLTLLQLGCAERVIPGSTVDTLLTNTEASAPESGDAVSIDAFDSAADTLLVDVPSTFDIREDSRDEDVPDSPLDVQPDVEWRPSLPSCGERYLSLRIRDHAGRAIEQCLVMRPPFTGYAFAYGGCRTGEICTLAGSGTQYATSDINLPIFDVDIGGRAEDRCALRGGSCSMFFRANIVAGQFPRQEEHGGCVRSRSCMPYLSTSEACNFTITQTGDFGTPIVGHLTRPCNGLSYIPNDTSTNPADYLTLEAVEFRNILLEPMPHYMCMPYMEDYTCTITR